MIGEREDIINETEYGTLNMRSYNIDGNEINAFYDSDNNLIFVLDNTINQSKPNVLLVINPDGDKKWDEILSVEYDVDLETIRPKQDNKYQKLDIEYSGLSVYENLINAYVAGDDLTELLVQLDILRDSAARHSAMTRLNVANEIISRTNVTVVKTKETIVRLQERIKTLRTKRATQKKDIGKIPTKQSASKILKLESQIEATEEKLKRAQKRLDSAQKRLETATVDAELAGDLLNQPALEIKQSVKPATSKTKTVSVKPIPEPNPITIATDQEDDDFGIDDEEEEPNINFDNQQEINNNTMTNPDIKAPEYIENDDQEDIEDNGVKPLFDKDPNIMNENIAFKPISFETPVIETSQTPEPVFDNQNILSENATDTETENEITNIPDIKETRPVLESMTPLSNDDNKNYNNTESNAVEQKPVLESMTAIEPAIHTPIQNYTSDDITNNTPNVQDTVPQQYAGVAPVAPVANTFNAQITEQNSRSKPSFLFYFLLIVLIGLSVFTLWMYQKRIDTTGQPVLTTAIQEQIEAVPEKPVVAESVSVTEPVQTEPEEEFVFDDETESVTENEPVEAVEQEPIVEEPEPVEEPEIIEEPSEIIEEPVPEPSIDDTESAPKEEAEPEIVEPEQSAEEEPETNEEIVEGSATETEINKPEYEVGSKDDNIFVSEQEYQGNLDEPDGLAVEEYTEEEEYYEE